MIRVDIARCKCRRGQNEGEPMSQERQHEGLPYDKCMSRARLWRRSHRDVAFASYSAPALSTGNGVFKLVQSAASAQPERGMVAPSNRALGPPRMTSPQAIPGGGDRANMAGKQPNGFPIGWRTSLDHPQERRRNCLPRKDLWTAAGTTGRCVCAPAHLQSLTGGTTATGSREPALDS